ncbi:MAG: ATP-dependent Clp protease proteolytic subunit [Varibaculum sp.]|nr:ATP-dependent Clp protease proteolytic subunit [Varibaculum sp.]
MSEQRAAEREDPKPLGLGDMVFNRLMKNRIIWLGSEVRDDNANAICAQLLLLAAEDPKSDIYLYINSPGGSITAGMAIYDTMQYIQPDVVTVGVGMAASMAQLLLTAGAPGKRYATPHTRVLMHQPLGGVGGTASEIRINADLILQMKRELAGIIAARTGKSEEQIREDSERDNWFTAEEALEYGFIDHIVENAQVMLSSAGQKEE